MRIPLRTGRLLRTGLAAATLTACGSQLPGVMSRTPATAAYADRAGSWMLPEAKHEDLVYAATGDNVYILSYPGGSVVGSLGVDGENLCSDRKGDVFVPTGGYVVLEYAHAGIKPIRTLHGGDIPLGCAVDPLTGNLAVTQEASGAGEVAIFRHAKGTSTWYRDPDIYTYGLCGYDDRGNLFVDGTGSANYIAELPKGSSTFANYALGSRFDAFGGIQWDGQHITLSNPTTHELYRLSFGKTSFKVLGNTHIHGWWNDYSGRWPYVQTWLQDNTFVAQSTQLAELRLWTYPAGGKTQKVLGPFESGDVDINGITVSLAPKR